MHAVDESEIQRFWEVARGHAGIDRLGVVVGASALGAVPPQAWSFGDSPRLADELLAHVLDGEKRACSTAVWELEHAGEPMPAVGELSILLDGAGHPRGLIRTTVVRIAAFEDVDAAFAAAEGEDDRTLESWRREHEKYWRRVAETTGGPEFTPDMPLVLEEFELLYQQPPASEQ
ncbi:ASCH domain-containing protein [Cellulomonas sp. P22]|uniref:ASCH domain-containing protein n=1 Tax=Cellulomonas sp. P22 TaxID=3373189 RepID=UPI0037C13EF8